MIVAATCVCRLPACAARNPLTRLITSIGMAPRGVETSRRALTNAGSERTNCSNLPRRHRLGAAIVVEAALGLASQPAGLDIFYQQRTGPVFGIREPFMQHLHDR